MTTKARATIDDLYRIGQANQKHQLFIGMTNSLKPNPPYLDGAWRLMICFHNPG